MALTLLILMLPTTFDAPRARASSNALVMSAAACLKSGLWLAATRWLPSISRTGSAVTEAVKDFTVVGLATAYSVAVTTAWVPSTTPSEPFSAVTSDDAGYVSREKYLNG